MGREIDRLTLAEQIVLAGNWVGLEIYTPDTLPVRTIAVVGSSVADCIRQLTARKQDPRRFEFRPFKRPL